MVANPHRRAQVCDAALELLGREGSRAVTHRAVDVEADLPSGTTANYYASRSALFVGMTQRLFEVLAPAPERLRDLAALPVEQAGPEYIGYIVERLLADPNRARAWIEVRLEAKRSPEIAELVEPILRQGLAADVEFHHRRGLRGGADVVRVLHHLVDGIALDALTIPLDPATDPVDTAKTWARRLLSS